MLQNLYKWIQDLAVWLVISAAALQAMPGKNYGKYVRFFTGLVTVLLLISPILKLTGTDQTLEELWDARQQEEQSMEEENFQKILEEASASEWLGSRAAETAEQEDSILENENQRNAAEVSAGTSETQNTEGAEREIQRNASEAGIEDREQGSAQTSRIRVEEIEIGK